MNSGTAYYRTFRRSVAFAVLVILLLASVAFAQEFWGSIKSDVYHFPDCRYAEGITGAFLIKFSSPEDAKKAGYRPCKVCNPPAPASG